MRKLLDRYTLGQFFSILFFSMIGFVVVFTLVDIIDHLDMFIDTNITGHEIVLYYAYTIPWFINIAFPMSLLVSTIFSFGLLQKRNEISAIKASGISIHRISIPLLVLGLIFSVFSFYFDNYVVTANFQKRAVIENKYSKRYNSKVSKNIKRNNIIRSVNNTVDNVIIIKRFSFKKNTAYNVSLQIFKDKIMRSRIDLPKMVWVDTLNKWTAKNYSKRVFNENGIINHKSTGKDTLLTIDRPSILTNYAEPKEMNYWELSEFIQQSEIMGEDMTRNKVNLHFKSAFGFSSFLMILFGLSLSIGKQRSSMALGLGLSIFVIFLYYATLKYGQYLGYEGLLSPWFSVWMANFIFVLFGTILFYKTRT
jgi:lipopolysaccharide export system permease protein